MLDGYSPQSKSERDRFSVEAFPPDDCFASSFTQADKVGEFVSAIQGADNTMITGMVKRLVAEGVINPNGSKSPLYNILKIHGLYQAGLTTWNKQV